MKSIIVGITGASGVIYGVRILEVLSQLKIETHLIITQAGLKNLEIETHTARKEVESMASKVYDEGNLTAPLASGSFKVEGMVVAPCSIKRATRCDILRTMAIPRSNVPLNKNRCTKRPIHR